MRLLVSIDEAAMKDLHGLDECVGRVKTVKATISLSNATERAVCGDETIRPVPTWHRPDTWRVRSYTNALEAAEDLRSLTCSFDSRGPPLPSQMKIA